VRNVYFGSADMKDPWWKHPVLWVLLALFGSAITAYAGLNFLAGSTFAKYMDSPVARAQEEKSRPDSKTKTTGAAAEKSGSNGYTVKDDGGKAKAAKAGKAPGEGEQDATAAAEGEDGKGEGAAEGKAKAEGDDKADMSPAERERAAAAGEDEKNFRDKKMTDIQKEIISQLSEMRSLQKSLDDALEKSKEQKEVEQNKTLAKLIKITNSMRPEEGAKMLTDMDVDLAVKILLSLTGAKSSKIMGAMEPTKAAVIGARMVELKPDIKLKDLMNNWKTVVEAEEKDAKSRLSATK